MKDAAAKRAKFDELNAENVRKAQLAKQQAFAKAKDAARQKINAVNDAKKRLSQLADKIGKATGAAKTKLEGEKTAMNTAIEKLKGERDAASEQYARMNQDDAREQVEGRQKQMNDIDERIAEAKAKAEW